MATAEKIVGWVVTFLSIVALLVAIRDGDDGRITLFATLLLVVGAVAIVILLRHQRRGKVGWSTPMGTILYEWGHTIMNTVRGKAPTPPSVPRTWLEIRKGGDWRYELDSQQTSWTFGSHPASILKLPSGKGVQPHHALLVFDGQRFVLHPREGVVLVNRRPLSAGVKLTPEAQFQIGETVFLFKQQRG